MSNNIIIDEFFANTGLHLEEDKYIALKSMVLGLIVNERGTVKNIAENTIDGHNARKLDRSVNNLNNECRSILKKVYLKFQTIAGLAEKEDGVKSLDEHVIPKSGKEIEGVDYFYSTSENKSILGLSMISTHYYDNNIEYPTAFMFFRRLEELDKYKKSSEYKKKNEIARELIRAHVESGSPCKNWALDSYFLTKENVKELKAHDLLYVSKIKRNWKCTYNRTKYTITELHDSIPETEYEMVKIKSPKSKKYRYFKVVSRNVFISKIGNHVVLFIKEYKMDKSGNLTEKYPEDWICLVSNMEDKPAEKIIEIYAKRWAIETSYRDETQNLKLKGCMRREIEGQYCFITLVFLAYMLLVWACYFGFFDKYNSDLRTLGQKQTAFKRLSEELFAEWIIDLKQRCKNCELTNIIYELIYKGDKGSSFYKQVNIL